MLITHKGKQMIKRVTLTIDEKVIKQIKALAKQEERTVSNLITYIVKKFLKENK